MDIIKNLIATITSLSEEVRSLKHKIKIDDIANSCECSPIISTITTEMLTITENKVLLKNELDNVKKLTKNPETNLNMENVTSQRGRYSKFKHSAVENSVDSDDMPNLTPHVLQIEEDNIDNRPTQTNGNNLSYAEKLKSNRNLGKEKKEDVWTEVKSKKKTNGNGNKIKIGTAQTNELTGVKKAWLHLGKLKEGTTVEQVQNFINKSFPDIDVSVTKLQSKGTNCSFRLGVDFHLKEALLKSDLWPCNVTLRRFLFLRRVAELPN